MDFARYETSIRHVARPEGAALIRSVERALSILACFSDSDPQLRVAEIARRLGLNQSTASRMISTIEQMGFVDRDPVSGQVQLETGLVTVAGVALTGEPNGRPRRSRKQTGSHLRPTVANIEHMFYIGASHVGPYGTIPGSERDACNILIHVLRDRRQRRSN
jgi:hypothetical protein